MTTPEHRMRIAIPNRATARARRLNRNHHARVWCECMSQQRAPGFWSRRGPREGANDPRRLGSWDELGVVDLRIEGSALRLFREHLERFR